MQKNNLENRVKALEERNRRVETDKGWEISWTRRILIGIFTFLAIGIYMWAINISDPWLNAIVPTVGFMLSTLALPTFRKIWLNIRNKK